MGAFIKQLGSRVSEIEVSMKPISPGCSVHLTLVHTLLWEAEFIPRGSLKKIEECTLRYFVPIIISSPSSDELVSEMRSQSFKMQGPDLEFMNRPFIELCIVGMHRSDRRRSISADIPIIGFDRRSQNGQTKRPIR